MKMCRKNHQKFFKCCTFWCLISEYFEEKNLPQLGKSQTFGLTDEWSLRCSMRLYLRIKDFPQDGQSHANRRPVCLFWCKSKCVFCLNLFPQLGHSHTNSFWRSQQHECDGKHLFKLFLPFTATTLLLLLFPLLAVEVDVPIMHSLSCFIICLYCSNSCRTLFVSFISCLSFSHSLVLAVSLRLSVSFSRLSRWISCLRSPFSLLIMYIEDSIALFDCIAVCCGDGRSQTMQRYATLQMDA